MNTQITALLLELIVLQKGDCDQNILLITEQAHNISSWTWQRTIGAQKQKARAQKGRGPVSHLDIKPVTLYHSLCTKLCFYYHTITGKNKTHKSDTCMHNSVPNWWQVPQSTPNHNASGTNPTLKLLYFSPYVILSADKLLNHFSLFLLFLPQRAQKAALTFPLLVKRRSCSQCIFPKVKASCVFSSVLTLLES